MFSTSYLKFLLLLVAFWTVCEAQDISNLAISSSRDLVDSWLGLLKGAANGDFYKGVLTRLGIATSGRVPGNTLLPLVRAQDIPWPRVFSEIINEFETRIASLAANLAASLRTLDAGR